MRQYFSGLFSSIFLCIGFILFSAAKNDNLGDITVNSIKVIDKYINLYMGRIWLSN